MKRRRYHLTRLQMLESVPRRNPEVRFEELDSGRMIAVYRQDARGLKRLLIRFLHMPEVGQVVLDETGAKVVRQIDGTRSVRELIAYLAQELKLSRKESEISLLKYLETLGQRRLIGFAVQRIVGDEK